MRHFFPLVKTATEQDMIITAMHTLTSITARVIEIDELHHEALNDRRIATKNATTSIAIEGKNILSFPALPFLYINHNADSYPTETIKIKMYLIIRSPAKMETYRERELLSQRILLVRIEYPKLNNTTAKAAKINCKDVRTFIYYLLLLL